MSQSAPSARPVRVMLVEDSPTVRTLLCHIVDRDPRLQIAAVCVSAEEALASIQQVAPDVVSMDIRLPGMDGLEATRRIMEDRPTPIVVIADAVHDATLGIAMNALKAGALTVVEKPAGVGARAYDDMAGTIATQLYIMSQVPVVRRRSARPARTRIDAPASPGPSRVRSAGLVALAASTGGPPALAAVLGVLPRGFSAPILLVQHMGPQFMEGFAAWLDGQTPLKVKLAEDCETPMAGVVHVAPGGRHLLMGSDGALRLSSDPPLAGQRPAADLLFSSLAQTMGPRAVGVLMTGMGEDGAKGLLAMKEAGAYTLIEDESTAVVFGMPGAAARLGAASLALPLELIGPRLNQVIPGAAA